MSARKGLMAPMTEITNTQDKVPMPACAVRKAPEARLAKGGSAMSGERRLSPFSHTKYLNESTCVVRLYTLSD